MYAAREMPQMSCGKKLPCFDVTVDKGEHPTLCTGVCVHAAQCNHAIEGMCECSRKELPC